MREIIYCRHRLHKFYIFTVVVFLIKIILAGMFSSDYQDKMFIPFIQTFLMHAKVGDWNIYQYYWNNNLLPSFPYPPVMLFVECIAGVLIKIMQPETIFLTNLISKVPLFIFDIITLYFLVKLFPKERRYAGVLYFASPVILYSTYIHGQLDVIPTAILIVSLYYLRDEKKKKNEIVSAFLYGLALLSKFHVVAVLPLLLLYIYRRGNCINVFRYIGIIIIELIIFLLPFWSDGFINVVLLNTEQSVVGTVQLSFKSVSLYVSVFAVLWVYLTAFYAGRMNHDLLMSFCGIIFAVFLALCPPMPGWYTWTIPFIVLFFIMISDNRYQNILLYVVLNGLYLLYFIFFHYTKYVDIRLLGNDLQFMKLNNPQYKNIMFTLLSGTLLFVVWQMYRYGVASNSFYKRKNTPFTIGISGDSGSGKSVFINIIERTLGEQNLLFIEGDGDHKWERGEKMWDEYTHLNPKANFLYRQAGDIQRLKSGIATSRVEYDHNTGTFSSAHRIRPKKYVLICGLHSLYLPQMRRHLDLKIYMDSDENLRRYWKMQRDIVSRGYSKEKILEQIEKRMPDAERYIYPQKNYADMIVQYFDKNLTGEADKEYKVIMSLRLFISAAVDIEPLLSELKACGVEAEYDFSRDLEHQVVEFDGKHLRDKNIPFRQIAEHIIPQIDEVTKQELNGFSAIEGILAVFVLTLISKIMQEEI